MITIKTTIDAPIEIVWSLYTEPEHIMNWNQATDDWHTPAATNELEVGGSFCYTMAAKDGSVEFDLTGKYTKIEEFSLISYSLDDDRKVIVEFEEIDDIVHMTIHFEAEDVNPEELQQAGWQAILDSFQRYVEGGFA